MAPDAAMRPKPYSYQSMGILGLITPSNGEHTQYGLERRNGCCEASPKAELAKPPHKKLRRPMAIFGCQAKVFNCTF
jgi:hypothetical protein